MRFGSICSGIEAASVAWGPLGWEAAWFSEIEAFPSAVLEHHYHDVKNIGNMLGLVDILRDGILPCPDIICGGTPCQSWSNAGLRKGVEDERGRLTFEFLNIIEAAQPQWVVWENVPGILSLDKGIHFARFLEAIVDLGYTINADILDAQFFGLAQRRRRVFLACQRADILMKKKTTTSLLTGITLLQEILHDILDDQIEEFAKGQRKSDARCRDVVGGLRRKMQSFLHHGESLCTQWLEFLVEESLSVAAGARNLDTKDGNSIPREGIKLPYEDIEFCDSLERIKKDIRFHYLSMSSTLKTSWEGLWSQGSASITSMEISSITPQIIFMCVETLPVISACIVQLNDSSPLWLKTASSFSTLIQKVMNYARPSNEKILPATRVFGSWADFRRQAELSSEVVASAREGFNPREVLFERESVRRDSAPSRETWQGVASDPQAGPGIHGEVAGTLDANYHKGPGSANYGERECVMSAVVPPIGASYGRLQGTDHQAANLGHPHLIPRVKTHRATSAEDAEIWREDHPVAPTLTSKERDYHDGQSQVVCVTGDITHTLKADGFDGSEDGTGRGQPIVAMSFDWQKGNDVNNCRPSTMNIIEEQTQTLGSTRVPPVAFANAGHFGVMRETKVSDPLRSTGGDTGNGGETLVTMPPPEVVRRLTVEECETLMGFPRDYTRIKWRKKAPEDCPDGPRYKALGNSWAVPVVRWIGRRIQNHLLQLSRTEASYPHVNPKVATDARHVEPAGQRSGGSEDAVPHPHGPTLAQHQGPEGRRQGRSASA